MHAYVGTFTADTVTGNQTVSGIVDADGNPFTPKALIVWGAYQTGAGFSDGQNWLTGLATATDQKSSTATTDDNTSPNDTNRTRSDTQLVLMTNVAGTNIRVGTLTSFGSGQFVINWTTVDAVAAVFHFVALGGDELLATVDNEGDTAMRQANILATAHLYAHNVQGGDACNSPAIGWSARDGITFTQGAACCGVLDGQTTSNTKRYQRTDRCTNIIASGGTLYNDYHLSEAGVVFDTHSSGSGVFVHGLGLSEVAAAAGSGLQPTATGTQGISGLGFSPKIVLFISVGQTAQTTVQTECRFCFGAADRTRQGWEWVGNAHGVNPSVAAGGQSTSAVLVAATPNATGASSTKQAEASVQSIDADGFTLNWTTADATQREYLWFALGDSGGGAPSGGEVSYAFCG